MDVDELRARRLHAQGLTGAGSTTVLEVVRRLGAVQAQEQDFIRS
jgi:hypothetical protein